MAVISGVRAKGVILNTPVSQIVQRVNTWNARDRHEEFLPSACIIRLRGGAGEILRVYYYMAASFAVDSEPANLAFIP